jgi:diguanylate cyclase (GGDEF)-like protein
VTGPPDRRKLRKTFRIDQHPGFCQLPKDRCTLTMLTGPTPGAMQPVNAAMALVLGRDTDLPAYIADRGISGRHATIAFERGAFWITDLDSTNGTYVNGMRIACPTALNDGDRIQLGENTLMRVSLQDATEQEAARRMYHAAVHDALTGVFNRGHLDAMLVTEFAFALRHQMPLSIVFIDLDHFSQVNNTYGHQAGDAALAATAQAIRNAMRTEDIVARYGGEEFVILARNIEASGAKVLAERIRRMVEAMTVPFHGAAIRITASLGTATHEPLTPYDSYEQLVAAADRAVYRAKADGRNCVRQALSAAPDSWRAADR